MNKAIQYLALLILSPLLITTALAVPIEPNAQIYKSLVGEKAVLNAMASMIKANGYKCDSISAAIPFSFSTGYTVTCNNYAYTYEIADKGGNWVVTLK